MMNALLGQLSVKRQELMQTQQQMAQQFQQIQQQMIETKSGLDKVEGAIILINQLIAEEEAKEKARGEGMSQAVPGLPKAKPIVVQIGEDGLAVVDIGNLEFPDGEVLAGGG